MTSKHLPNIDGLLFGQIPPIRRISGPEVASGSTIVDRVDHCDAGLDAVSACPVPPVLRPPRVKTPADCENDTGETTGMANDRHDHRTSQPNAKQMAHDRKATSSRTDPRAPGPLAIFRSLAKTAYVNGERPPGVVRSSSGSAPVGLCLPSLATPARNLSVACFRVRIPSRPGRRNDRDNDNDFARSRATWAVRQGSSKHAWR